MYVEKFLEIIIRSQMATDIESKAIVVFNFSCVLTRICNDHFYLPHNLVRFNHCTCRTLRVCYTLVEIRPGS